MRSLGASPAGKIVAALPVLLVVLPVLLAGGCGGAPRARPWAASVCEALAPWRGEITALNRRAQQQMTVGTTPAQAKEHLIRLLSGAESASETARAKVSEAGVPDVADGAAVARGFQTSLSAVRDAYQRARTAIEKLEPGPASQFYDQVAAVLDTLRQEYERSALDTTDLDSPELVRAFGEVPECR